MVLISSLALLAERLATWEFMSLDAGATAVVCSAPAVVTATFLSVTASSGARDIARSSGALPSLDPDGAGFDLAASALDRDLCVH